jgi:hypothetical protein
MGYFRNNGFVIIKKDYYFKRKGVLNEIKHFKYKN